MSNMRSLCLFVVLLILVQFLASEMKQERATVVTCNPKYLTDCYGMTRRLARGEPYKTNLTAGSRYSFGNNVTVKVILSNVINVEVLNIKICDLPNVPWVWEYVQMFSNIYGDCPYKPGLYGFYNMELPPKNTPKRIMNIFKGTFHVRFYFVGTTTGEIILENDVIVSV